MFLDGINSKPKYVDKNYDPYNISTEKFLKIYLKMLELQDPTEPLDVKDMIQQNYQLQQISFLTNLEQTMKSLAQNQMLNYITQSSFLIGKKAVFNVDTIEDVSQKYVLISPDNYNNVQISIIDTDSGKVVKSYQADLKEGINELDLSNLTAGNYRVQVSYNGQNLNDIILGVEAIVNYVSLAGNEPVLGTSAGEKPLKDVIYVST
jgi:flagellar hook assembly protein FlgD